MRPLHRDVPDTVLVTGGLGRSGRWIVDRLADDYTVCCLDRTHPGFEIDARANVDFVAADLTDAGDAFDVVTDLQPDTVIHWAAIPAPERHAATRVFETNVTAAYNTLDAAGRVGADVVQASSEASYGLAFAAESRLPAELPMTVDHPQEPADPYGLGKVVAEEAAETIVRRDGIAVTSVRPSWIQYPGEYECRSTDDLAAGAGNCWSYVDARDVADLVAAALAETAEATGGGDSPVGPGTHEAVNCVAADNALGRPLLDLVREAYGGVPDDCVVDEGDDRGAYAIDKAERLFDWEPSRSWRDAADESVAEPTLFEE